MTDYRKLRILITRLSAIGDCVLTAPVATALRDHLPRAYIAWAIEKPSVPLLNGHPALDELITLPRGWLKSPTFVWRLRRHLRERQFDVAIDAQSLTKSALVGFFAGARRRIGFAGSDGRELSKWLNNELVERTAPHMVDRSLQLLLPLGIRDTSPRFDLPVYDEAERIVTSLLDRERLDRFAMINVGAGWPSKLWPPERFAAVAEHLGRRHGLPSLIIWAGDEERTRAAVVAKACPAHARLAPATSLTELATLARRAALFVGSDTGPLHIAAAVGATCVGLYGPTQPEICGPYGPVHVVIQKFFQDGGHRERRGAQNIAMQAITESDVCGACDQALARQANAEAVDHPAQPAA